MAGRIRRRDLLAGIAPACALTLAPGSALAAGAAQDRAALGGGEFRHGVASGDPLANRVILWSRVSGGPTSQAVYRWTIAEDAGFTRAVRSGPVLTGPARDWTLKVDVAGLEPGRTWWYRFESADHVSPVGRTQTLPAGPVARMGLAVCSCSNYPAGFFNAYRAMAERDDIDVVMHLGDYLYEYGADGYAGTQGRALGRVVSPAHALVTLGDYRARYAQYRRDPDLQALHARHPVIAIWDDHESANDAWRGGAENHDPDTEGDWFIRREVATRAWYEWLPVREPADRSRLAAWRSFDFGTLVTLAVVEARHVARDRQLAFDPQRLDEVQAALAEDRRTLLGAEQLGWLERTWAAARARGVTWQLLGSPVVLAPLATPDLAGGLSADEQARLPGWLRERLEGTRLGLAYNLDAWDGYPAERQRLYELMTRHTRNAVVVSGDSHTAWSIDHAAAGGPAGLVEVGVTAVTSPGFDETLGLPPGRVAPLLRAANPHVRFVDTWRKGFALLEFTPERLTARHVLLSTIARRSVEMTEAGALIVASRT
ncbi:MAG: alkaline phosphatase [Gammaproteobacteria bacterium]|nr:MAG: alkaline phosphatase [Gammaproteobacteria bacterium]